MNKQTCSDKKQEVTVPRQLVTGMEILFDIQEGLLAKLPNGILFNRILLAKADTKNWQDLLEHMLSCMHNELEELRDWSSWKSWKKYPQDNNSKNLREMQYEAIDLLHFLLNIFLILGLSPAETARLYLDKNKQNHKRQENGY